MLIKNYVFDQDCAPAGGKVNIIEKVTDVTVHMNPYAGAENGPRLEGPAMPTTWIEQSAPSNPNDYFYFVDYTDKNGVRSRLKVTAYAYICNDEGKTVEKVGVNSKPLTIR